MNPSNLQERRSSLQLSTQQLADHVGVPVAYIELAEREPLGDEVTFLLNMALSLLEIEQDAYQDADTAIAV